MLGAIPLFAGGTTEGGMRGHWSYCHVQLATQAAYNFLTLRIRRTYPLIVDNPTFVNGITVLRGVAK